MRTSAGSGVLVAGLGLIWSSVATAQIEQTGPIWLTSRANVILMSSSLKSPLPSTQNSVACACLVEDCSTVCDLDAISGDTLIVVDTVLQDTEADAIDAFQEALQEALQVASGESLFWEDVEVVVTDLDISPNDTTAVQAPSVNVYRWRTAQEQDWTPSRVWVPGDPTP